MAYSKRPSRSTTFRNDLAVAVRFEGSRLFGVLSRRFDNSHREICITPQRRYVRCVLNSSDNSGSRF